MKKSTLVGWIVDLFFFTIIAFHFKITSWEFWMFAILWIASNLVSYWRAMEHTHGTN